MAILFDLDDTLIDHTAAFRMATEVLYESVASPLSLEQFHLAWSASLRRQFDRYLAGELSYDQQRLARVREVIDPTLSDEAADRIFALYLDQYEAGWWLFPDVESALEKLPHHRMGIVTNGQVRQQRAKLERTGLLHRFDCVVISEECGTAKPDPAIFLRACSLLGEAPSSCVHVGDHYDLDVMGARRAGLGSIWLDRAGNATTQHSPPIIRSLNDVADHVSASRHEAG
jgi:putative hydrolase of the HAD superfamily